MSDEMTAMDNEKARAANWFRQLRDEITCAFEQIEDSHGVGPMSDLVPGRFDMAKTQRNSRDGLDAGGGEMCVLRNGRVFEKVGVNISVVYGTLDEMAQRAVASRGVPGMDTESEFWAAGISVVAHMQNPHVPAVHMNTRMFWTPITWWFGGGCDLNPSIEYEDDTRHFHATIRTYLDKHGDDHYPRLKKWADEYFHIPHRNRARGVGGIFMDDQNTGDWQADFALTRDIGRCLLPAYVPLVERRRTMDWSESDRETQLIYRGLYAEYNLVYDRGTKFGLASGHDSNAVLMSLPPIAKWV